MSFLTFFALTTIYTAVVFNYEFMTKFWAIPEVMENSVIYWTIPFVLLAVIIIFHLIMTIPIFGKLIMATSFILSASVLYMIQAYGVGMSYEMVQNFAKTDTMEATSYFNIYSFTFVFLLGVIPAIFIMRVKFTKKVDSYPMNLVRGFIVMRMKIALINLCHSLLHRIYLLLLALLILVSIGVFNYKEYAFIFRANNHLYAQMVPGYLGNIYRYTRDVHFSALPPHREIGTDAKLIHPNNGKPNLFVFVIGETARAQNFSYYGYKRDTNIHTKEYDLIVPSDVTACSTSTAKSLPCMMSSLSRSDYDYATAYSQDNILDIIQRAGASVMWYDNNSSHYDVPNEETMDVDFTDRSAKSCSDYICYDIDLLKDFNNKIKAMKNDNKFVVLHMIGSHGPKYYERYPRKMEQFSPACNNPEVSKCPTDNLINTYDNSILYTDYVLSQTIKRLQTYQDKYNVAMLYVSDHGESLGENGLYLHGVPFALAPDVQLKIPLILWLPKAYATANNINRECVINRVKKPLSHDNIFHSLLGGYGVSTKIKSNQLDIFSECKK